MKFYLHKPSTFELKICPDCLHHYWKVMKMLRLCGSALVTDAPHADHSADHSAVTFVCQSLTGVLQSTYSGAFLDFADPFFLSPYHRFPIPFVAFVVFPLVLCHHVLLLLRLIFAFLLFFVPVLSLLQQS